LIPAVLAFRVFFRSRLDTSPSRTAPLGTNCPAPTGPDYDFGSGPNEITYKTSKGSTTIIGAGQKSGIYYALNPDTGAELWHTQVGPSIQWGSASDGNHIYVAIANPSGVPSSEVQAAMAASGKNLAYVG
jgi:outer membrane protein assembly factor BamB